MKTEKKYFFANWKMSLNYNDALNFFKALNKYDQQSDNVICAIAVPSLYIYPLNEINDTKISLMAQDVSIYDYGSYTNQISANMYQDFKIKYALVGHSETRKFQNVTDHDVYLKAKQCLKNGIVPIICIGEDLETYQNKQVISFLLKQLSTCIKDLEIDKIIVAYEPLWAIGTNNFPSNEQIANIINELKNHYKDLKLLYGGSVNANNINHLIDISNLDGVLVGKASNEINSFMHLMKVISNKN